YYPIEISSRASANFHISDLPTFEQYVKKMRGANTFADRVRFRFTKGFVRTDDGKTFRVRLSRGIRQVWAGRARLRQHLCVGMSRQAVSWRTYCRAFPI